MLSLIDFLVVFYRYFQFRIITAKRIRRMPVPDITVKDSEKQIIPMIVATTGSIVAMIPALLASTERNPSVYDRKGITAVTRAVWKHRNTSPAGSEAAENFDSISAGRQISHEPIAANINV
jgi:hypothetical protein